MIKRSITDLLKGVRSYELKGDGFLKIEGLAIDSRKVEDGYLFVALKGTDQDGHQYIERAIDKGAIAIMCEHLPDHTKEGVVYVVVENCRDVVGIVADEFYDHPSSKLKCVGITGTNGKTSIATLLYSLFKEMGYTVGLISTIEILINEKKWIAELTTPDVISLHGLFSEMVTAGCTHVFMEVSSHAVVQNRIGGVKFSGGVFTNITHDHLDYHGTFKAYIKAKQSFFSRLDKDAFALVNADDKNGKVMLEQSKAVQYLYSLRTLTDYKAKVFSEDRMGMYLELNGHKFMTRLMGRYNASNLAAVYGVADLLEEQQNNGLIEKLSGLTGAKGRMEVVSYVPRVVVDYAHTPDALSNVLNTLRDSLEKGKLISVVGCGGDRDVSKRSEMGRQALEKSDIAIFTSDNPRSEDPGAIIEDMKMGLRNLNTSKLLEIIDRKSAIKTAITLASDSDTILIAGKGHEEYQDINGVKHFFSDQQIVKDILSKDI